MTDGVWHLGNGPSLSQTWPIRKQKRKRKEEKTTDTDTLQRKRLNWLQHHHPVLAPRCRHFAELRAVVLRMYVLVPVAVTSSRTSTNTSISKFPGEGTLLLFQLPQAVTQTLTITQYPYHSLLYPQFG